MVPGPLDLGAGAAAQAATEDLDLAHPAGADAAGGGAPWGAWGGSWGQMFGISFS